MSDQYNDEKNQTAVAVLDEVPLDEGLVGLYAWVAVYGEEDFLFQFDDDGVESPYGMIDRERLKEFHIIRKSDQATLFALALEPEQRLIFRRRVSMSGNTGEKQWEILLVGWQQTIGAKNIQSLNWIFANGSIIQTGKFQEDHHLFYGIELIEGLETGKGAEETALD